MNFRDHLRNVRHTLAGNRMRSFLTLLGVIIGAGSIVLLADLLTGGREALLRSSQEAAESDVIKVESDEPPPKQFKKTRRELTRTDGNEVRDGKELGTVEIASENFRRAWAYFRGEKKQVGFTGVEPGSQSLYRLKIEKGRFLTDEDVRENRHVCVVGHEIWELLLGAPDSLEKMELTVDRQVWLVIGVLEKKPIMGSSDGVWMWDRKVLTPISSFDSIYGTKHTVDNIFIRLHGVGELAGQLKATAALVEDQLLRRHLGVKNFKVDVGDGGQDQEKLIVGVIELLLLCTGLLSLFVGGINIMNIMLVTVTERTREIGVRRAVGATPRAIMMQFLLESSAIAFAGGLLGVLGGILVSWLVALGLSRTLGQWNFHVEIWAVALGLALSTLTGIFFGLLPARRAAQLNPVEALRFE